MEADEVKAAAAAADMPPEEAELVPEDNANSLETDLLAVNDITADIDENESDIDEGADAAAAMESLIVDLKTAMENGGLDKAGARILRSAVNHHAHRLGLGMSPTLLPSLENHGGVSSRMSSTKIAMESLKDTLKKIWDGIIAAVNKGIDFFKAFYAKLFDAATKMKERAVKLHTAAESVDATKMPKTFDNERLVGALHMSGKVPGDASGSKRLLEVAQELLKDVGNTATAGEALAGSFEAASTSGGAAKAAAEALGSLDSLVTPLGKQVTNPAAEGFEAPGEGVELYRSDELPGGKAIITKKATKTTPETVAASGSGIADYKANGTKPSGAAVPALSQENAKSVCDDIGKLADLILSSKASIDKASGAKTRIVKAAAKIGALKVTDEEAAQLKVFQQTASGLSKFIDQPFAAFNNYALQSAGKALLDQVEQSLKLFDKGGDAKALPNEPLKLAA